ncbi:UNVERIFIED_CONTAM: hypothetical protein K2H54_037719 [Gekko kuhli]
MRWEMRSGLALQGGRRCPVLGSSDASLTSHPSSSARERAEAAAHSPAQVCSNPRDGMREGRGLPVLFLDCKQEAAVPVVLLDPPPLSDNISPGPPGLEQGKE